EHVAFDIAPARKRLDRECAALSERAWPQIARVEFVILAVFSDRAEKEARVVLIVAIAPAHAPPIRSAAGAALHAETHIDFVVVLLAAEPRRGNADRRQRGQVRAERYDGSGLGAHILVADLADVGRFVVFEVQDRAKTYSPETVLVGDHELAIIAIGRRRPAEEEEILILVQRIRIPTHAGFEPRNSVTGFEDAAHAL